MERLIVYATPAGGVCAKAEFEALVEMTAAAIAANVVRVAGKRNSVVFMLIYYVCLFRRSSTEDAGKVARLIVCGPATPFAVAMTARREPGPVSFVVVTV